MYLVFKNRQGIWASVRHNGLLYSNSGELLPNEFQKLTHLPWNWKTFLLSKHVRIQRDGTFHIVGSDNIQTGDQLLYMLTSDKMKELEKYTKGRIRPVPFEIRESPPAYRKNYICKKLIEVS